MRGERVSHQALSTARGALQQDDVPRGREAELVADPHLLVARPARVRGFEGEEFGGCHGVDSSPGVGRSVYPA